MSQTLSEQAEIQVNCPLSAIPPQAGIQSNQEMILSSALKQNNRKNYLHTKANRYVLFKRVILSFVLSSLPPLLYAETPPIIDNGAWLASLCKDLITPSNPPSGANIGICVGYVRGVIQSWYTAESQVNPEGASLWIKKNGNISSYESAKLVANYVQSSPENANKSAVDLIITAITEAYPMPTPTQPASSPPPPLLPSSPENQSMLTQSIGSS